MCPPNSCLNVFMGVILEKWVVDQERQRTPKNRGNKKSRSKRDTRQDVPGSDREQLNTEERQKLLHTVTEQSLSELRIMSASSRADSLISLNTQTHKRTTMLLMNIIVQALRKHTSADLSTTAP